MSQTTKSEKSFTSSSVSKPAPRSLIVSNVSFGKDETWLYNDLSKNYCDVKRLSRNHDQYGNQLGSIRVDFDSEEVVSDILNDNAIYIADKPYYIRPYWPLVCHRCQNEGHKTGECPERPVSEWRLAELLEEQKTNFETLIKDFENKWNTRLSTFKPPSNNTNINQLIPVINDLATVSNQLNQCNIQTQKQLSTIANHVGNMQTKTNN